MKTLLLGIAVILFGIALTVGLNPLGIGLIGVIVSAFGLAFAIVGYFGKEK